MTNEESIRDGTEEMSKEQAGWVAYLRCSHGGATYGYIKNVFEAMYGAKHTRDICDSGSHTVGLRLVSTAERVLGLDRGALDQMRFGSMICQDCKKESMSLHYDTDTEKECAHCGGWALLFVNNEKKGDGER